MMSTTELTPDSTARLFETELANIIIQNNTVYQTLFLKIMFSIKTVLDNNTDNSEFNRLLFAAFSSLQSEFSEIQNFDNLYEPTLNVFAATSFFKIFFEHLIQHVDVPKPVLLDKLNLSFFAQRAIISSPTLLEDFRKHMMPDELFLDENRGRVELGEFDRVTKKFGITLEDEAPEKFAGFFENEYSPAQFQFICDVQAPFSGFLFKNHFPYVSGPSGTAATILVGMMQLNFYTRDEFRLFMSVLAAVMIGRGHHSFIEVVSVGGQLGISPKIDGQRRFFYEGRLPDQIIQLEEYKRLISDAKYQTYLELEIQRTEILPNYNLYTGSR